jgi:hypothetical protein
MPHPEVRNLLLAVVAEQQGLYPVGNIPRGDHEDIIFKRRLLLADRELLVRILYGPADAKSVKEAKEDATRDGFADFLVVAMHLAEPGLVNDDHVLTAEGLADFLTVSSLVAPNPDGTVTVDREGFRVLYSLSNIEAHDRLGLQWLPTLARNRVPAALKNAGTAEDLFEQYFFRLATFGLRLRGRRLGTAMRGQRVGDAILTIPGTSHLILTDCKAAAAGYRMDVNDERRLVEYAASSHEWAGRMLPVSCVVVVSSHFPGSDDARHPFHARREKFRGVGSDLAYIRADDLVQASLSLFNLPGDDTSVYDRINWSAALAKGLVDRQALLDVIADAATPGHVRGS